MKTTGWNQKRIARHPSIWDATIDLNFHRKATRVGEQQTLVNMVKRTHNATNSKPLMDTNNSSDDDEQTSSRNLLSAYGIAEPPPKKFKDLDCPSPSTSQKITTCNVPESPKRNPFKVKPNASPKLIEQTKITKENVSLIRNQSPVKRIEYTTASPIKRMDYRKLEKLSKFQRTVLPHDQNTITISRFFSHPAVKSESVTPMKIDYINPTSKTDTKAQHEPSVKTEKTEEEIHDDSNARLRADAVRVKVEPGSVPSPDFLYMKMSSANNRCNSNGLERERTPDRDDASVSGGSTGTTIKSQPLFEDADNLSCSLIEVIPERPLIVIDDDDDVVDVGGDLSPPYQEDINLVRSVTHLISPSMVSQHLNVR